MQGEAGGDRHGNSLQVIEVHKEIKKKKVKQKNKIKTTQLGTKFTSHLESKPCRVITDEVINIKIKKRVRETKTGKYSWSLFFFFTDM